MKNKKINLNYLSIVIRVEGIPLDIIKNNYTSAPVQLLQK